MPILRDIFRAKGRSTLTIVGVAVGVFILVLVGSLAEKSRMQLDAIDTYRAGSVTVADEVANLSAFSYATDAYIPCVLRDGALDDVRAVDGVREAWPQVAVQLDPMAFWMGVPSTIVGGIGKERLLEFARLSEGRYIDEDEAGTVALGAEVAEQFDAELGDTVTLRGKDFEVVGLLERSSITAVDQSALVPIEDARALFIDSIDAMYREQLGTEPVILTIEVLPAEGVDTAELVRRITTEVEGVSAMRNEDIKNESTGTTSTFDGLVLGMGVIALFGGGLSVLNTMTVAAIERTREVGIKRALGASTVTIVRDVLVESVLIGLIGGVLGALFGGIAAVGVGQVTASAAGLGLFAVTPRLLAGSVVFAVVLGLVGGLYPAVYAARLDPTDALAKD